MDAFSYLSVLLSIILGLAITQVLQGFRGLMLARSRLRIYWPCLVWAFIVLTTAIQAWWAMYDLRLRTDWHFLDFAVVLAQTIPLYLMAGLVLPDIDSNGVTDLRRHYFENHRWFFVLLILFLVISILKPLALDGRWPAPGDLGFQLIFIGCALIGASTSREWYHKLQAPLAALGIGSYIALLFAHLR